MRNAVYFCSDLHFGIDGAVSSKLREQLFVHWLDNIAYDATDIFLVGDIFDFWFEWRHVIPKGYSRILGTLARLSDSGVGIHFFTGNHDVWMFSYFQNEIGAKVYSEHTIVTLQGKKCYIAHGDGLDKEDFGYNFLKKIFRNRLCQRLYASLHPSIATMLATRMSKTSRIINQNKNLKDKFREEKLTQIQIEYALQTLKDNPDIDYFIFGHQHSAFDLQLNQKSTLHIIGNWINDFDYLRMEKGNVKRYSYKNSLTYFSE